MDGVVDSRWWFYKFWSKMWKKEKNKKIQKEIIKHESERCEVENRGGGGGVNDGVNGNERGCFEAKTSSCDVASSWRNVHFD